MSSESSTTHNHHDGSGTGGDHHCHSSWDDEKDSKARAVLKEEGLDPDNINKECLVMGKCVPWTVTPMHHFSGKGNLQMCQYLLFRGADCRKISKYGCFPMFIAAAYGHLAVVAWLYHVVGAKDEIRKVHRSGFTPVRIALQNGRVDMAKWFIRNGALSSPHDAVDGGGIDAMVMRRDLDQAYGEWDEDERLPLLSWAQDAVTTHEHFQLFLKGTILSSSTFRRHPKNEYATRSKRMRLSSTTTSSSLVMFKGKSGILELISKYLGNPKPKELRIFRQLIRLLSTFIEDVPFVEEEDDDDDDDY